MQKNNQKLEDDKRKAYLNKLGGDRKVLGNGTKGTEELVQKVASLSGYKFMNYLFSI